MLPLKDARETLYQLLGAEFVHLQEVPKAADHAPYHTFYLFTVNPQQMYGLSIFIHCSLVSLQLSSKVSQAERRDHQDDEEPKDARAVRAGSGGGAAEARGGDAREGWYGCLVVERSLNEERTRERERENHRYIFQHMPLFANFITTRHSPQCRAAEGTRSDLQD